MSAREKKGKRKGWKVPRQWPILVILTVVLYRLLKPSPTSTLHYARERDEDGQQVDFPPLPPLANTRARWPPDLRDVACVPKIYVYPADSLPSLSHNQTAQCRWSQYSSELLLTHILRSPTSPASRLYLTDDPSLATFFLIPTFPACYLFNCWVAASWDQRARCRVDEDYLLPTLHKVQHAFPYWNASQGRDHLIFHPMDRVDEYYQPETRSLMSNATYLTTLGDLRSPGFRNASWYRPTQDVVIPSSTHLLHSYLVHPRDYLSPHGHPLLHPPDPPPSSSPPDEDWLDGIDLYRPSAHSTKPRLHWSSVLSFRSSSPSTTSRSRPILALFRGSGASSPSDRYSLGIRSLFFPSSTHPGFSSLPDFDLATTAPSNPAYALLLSRSKFGLTPPGHTLDTTRLYEYLAFGVVPVFIGTEALVLPFSSSIPWPSLSVSIPRSKAHLTPKILRSIDAREYDRLRGNVWAFGRGVVIEGRKARAWDYLARELCRLRPELAERADGTGRGRIELSGYVDEWA